MFENFGSHIRRSVAPPGLPKATPSGSKPAASIPVPNQKKSGRKREPTWSPGTAPGWSPRSSASRYSRPTRHPATRDVRARFPRGSPLHHQLQASTTATQAAIARRRRGPPPTERRHFLIPASGLGRDKGTDADPFFGRSAFATPDYRYHGPAVNLSGNAESFTQRAAGFSLRGVTDSRNDQASAAPRDLKVAAR